MLEIVISLAKTAPIEILIDQLEESIKDYKENKNEKTTSSLEFHCMLIATKLATAKDSTDAVIDRMKKHQKIAQVIGVNKG